MMHLILTVIIFVIIFVICFYKIKSNKKTGNYLKCATCKVKSCPDNPNFYLKKKA